MQKDKELDEYLHCLHKLDTNLCLIIHILCHLNKTLNLTFTAGFCIWLLTRHIQLQSHFAPHFLNISVVVQFSSYIPQMSSLLQAVY